MPRRDISFDGEYAAILWSRDVSRIREIVARELSFDVAPCVVEKWLAQLGREPAGGWSNASVVTWLKRRLDDWYPYPPGERETNARITVELHVFPIWWHTTPAQDERVTGDETLVPESTARNRIGRTKLKQINPVDKTAMRVAGR
jgi:hypothetical protein